MLYGTRHRLFTTVHKVRKRYKKLRRLIRFIRPAFEITDEKMYSYVIPHASFPLYVTPSRSSKPLTTCRPSMPDRDKSVFHKIRQELIARRQRIMDDLENINQRFEVSPGKMHKLKQRIEKW